MYASRAEVAFEGEESLRGGATVLTDGHHIHAVESYGFATPSDGTVVTFKGTLLRGLIDTHTNPVGDSERNPLDRVAGYCRGSNLRLLLKLGCVVRPTMIFG